MSRTPCIYWLLAVARGWRFGGPWYATTLLAVFSLQAGGQTTTIWSGNGTSWNSAANWSAGLPGPNDIAVFANKTNRDPTLTANSSVGKIIWSGNDDAEAMGGAGYTLTLNGVLSSGTLMGMDLQLARNPTFSPTLSLGAGQTWQVSYNGNGASITAAGGVLLNGFDLTLKPQYAANNMVISSAVSGTGNISTTGAGTVTFSGSTSNTYTGNVTVTSGKLVLGKTGGATAITGNLLIGSGTGTSTVQLNGADQISSASSVIFASAGTPALNLNGYADSIGSLSTTNTAAVLSLGTGALTTGANNSSTTYAGTVTGSGSLAKAGTGTFTLANAASSYTGPTTIGGGVLSIASLVNGGSASAIGSSTATALNLVLNGGTLQYTGAATTTNRLFTIGSSGGTIESSGTGVLAFSGTGSIGFTGSSTHSLSLIGSADGSLAAVLGDFSGFATSLTKSGAGTWTLIGNSTYTGTTTIAGGTLQLGSGGTSGGIGTGNVINDGALVVNRSNAAALAGNISGSGSLNQSGSGTTTLSGTNSYTGGTTISAGTLKLTSAAGMGPAGAAVTMSGGTLELASDTVAKYNVSVTGTSNTIIANRATVGSGLTQELGTLTMSANRVLTVQPGANVTGDYGVKFDSAVIAGNITFSVANDTTGTGTLTLGAITPTGASSVTKTGAGTLVYSGTNTYAGGTTIAAGTVIVNPFAQLADATSGLTMSGGKLTLQNANQTVSSITGAAGTVELASGHALTINESGNITYGGTFSGVGTTTITKASTGTLSLSGDNSAFLGTMKVTGGQLIATSGSALGGSGATISVSSGAALGLSGGITTTAGNAILAGSGVNGSGALYNSSGANVFGGNISLDGNATVRAAAGSLTLSGQLKDGAAASGPVTLTLNPTAGTTITVAGQITDVSKPVGLAHTGDGTVILSNAANNYHGNTTIGTAGGLTTGTLRVGTANALTSVNSGSVITVYSGALDLNNLNATAFGSIAMGGGAFGSSSSITTGTGTLTLNHDLTFDAANNANGATISGNLALSAGTHFVRVSDSLAAANDLTISAAISGNGQIDKYNAGTLLLSGNNTYTGLTTVQQGILSVQHNNALGSTSAGTSVSTGATIQLSSPSGLVIGDGLTISGQGVLSQGALRNVAGNNTWTGSIAVATTNARIQSDAGTALTLSGGINSVTGGSIEIGGAGNTTLAGSIGGGVTGLTKKDASTLIISGGNSFSGAVSVQGGTLSARNNTALGTGNTVTIQSGATLAFDNTGLGGNLFTSNATLNVSGAGVGSAGALQNTAGANQFNGSVILGTSATVTASAGTSLVITGGISGSSATTLTVGTAAQNGSLQFSGPVSGFNLVKTGALSGADGVLTISGGGTIGTVDISGGRVAVTAGTLTTGALNAGTSTSLLIASGGTVNVQGNATFASGTLNGSAGTLQVNGNYTVRFNGTITAPNMTLSVGGNASGAVTVYLGPSITFGTIEITGDTILDFGDSSRTTLTSTNLKITNPNATIQVRNWATNSTQALADVWKATTTVNNGTLAAGTNQTTAPMPQISFTAPVGSTGSTTTWVGNTSQGWFDHEIRPTPEPRTYGALFIGSCVGLLGFRRFRRRTTA